MQITPPTISTGICDQQILRRRHTARVRGSEAALSFRPQPCLLKSQSLSQEPANSPSYVKSVKFTSLRFSHSDRLNSMCIDGAASISDIQPACERTRSQPPITFSRLAPPEKQTSILKSERRNHRNARNPSSESSQTHLIKSQAKKKSPVPSRSGKARLPWLDGSRSRQGSIPTVPGAFHDESPSVVPNSTINPPARSPDPQQLATTAIPLASEPPTDPQKPQEVQKKFKQLVPPPNPDTGATKAGMASNSADPATSSPVNSAAESIQAVGAPDVSQDNLENSKTKRPATLIAMARELYKTDSSAFSDSDASIKGGRQRALGDTLPLDPVKPPLTVETTKLNDKPLIVDENPSPKAPVGPEKISSLQGPNVASPLSPERPVSASLQPIRSRKVTMTPDDMPQQQANRNHSISVQPIKSRTNSRPLNENAPGDHDIKPVSKTPTALQPAAQSLHESIEDLETLMQEAMRLAEDAAQQGKLSEVPAILDEARFALHRASVVQAQQEKAMTEHMSPSESSIISCCSSCSSLDPSRSKVVPRRPTIIRARSTNHGASSIDQPSFGSGPQAIWDEDWPHHRFDQHSNAVDWAYSRQDRPSGIMAKGKSRQEPTNGATEACDLQTNTSGPQEASCLIQRSQLTRGDVREYIRQNSQPPYVPRTSSLPKQRRVGLEGANSPEPEAPSAMLPAPAPSAASFPAPAEVPTNRNNSRAPTQGESTENWGRDKYDERDYIKTADILKGKNHVTLKEGEHFSIHHGHVRQPIARNWSSSRKRFTAVITCLNTALVGVLIGIYVCYQ